ncbi:hypothetical protein SPRG_10060 [Saprolegnia parasitica CBS 223.65]|uniref:Uncharacterized protein n=1 Tax=Saprolegnia parasitica (strain CBS 223.65) TaxID=695850 RepID=A0A067C448_SAPPC|nr:hypothetical protein SPRG_10060 [Saprolegnia parasitica CBS 223.65]KDO23915.1 hypothetical protein SPRG_10060 [Saprolegnia parasitica CBS 223.65]|eukprot:XP_012205381.1 hypothetical protein SPRG_10060 [Saprolegnia parasitica CBS 223.65]
MGCKDVPQASPVSSPIVHSKRGFIDAVVQAYNRHHNLVLRPDDVWLAIMIQFSFHINGNARWFRSSLVKHRGKKNLTIQGGGDVRSASVGGLAKFMANEMTAHLVDPALKDWVLPGFSTTTDNDVVVGSVVFMAAMKKYFSYKFELGCGIPFVTLLGTVDDWQDVRARSTKLATFGGYASTWSRMLAPVLDQFVLAAKGQPDVAFWDRICHHIGGGSGPSYLSGWLSVFCVFNEEGQWQGGTRSVTLYTGEVVTADFPIVESQDVPPGYVTVDVAIDDNGVRLEGLLFAGHMSFSVQEEATVIAPELGWAIALKNGEHDSSDDDDAVDDQWTSALHAVFL